MRDTDKAWKLWQSYREEAKVLACVPAGHGNQFTKGVLAVTEDEIVFRHRAALLRFPLPRVMAVHAERAIGVSWINIETNGQRVRFVTTRYELAEWIATAVHDQQKKVAA